MVNKGKKKTGNKGKPQPTSQIKINKTRSYLLGCLHIDVREGRKGQKENKVSRKEEKQEKRCLLANSTNKFS